MSYVMEYATDVKPNEEIIEEKGVKVLIDPKAIIYLLGTEMDYKKEKFSSQFVFNNPNETEDVDVVSLLKFNHYSTSQTLLMWSMFKFVNLLKF